MEAIVIFLVTVIALAVSAVRFGCDSRSGPSSPEQAYSQLGLTWGESESTLSGRPKFFEERGPRLTNRQVAASGPE
jgi:hypothetical protein